VDDGHVLWGAAVIGFQMAVAQAFLQLERGDDIVVPAVTQALDAGGERLAQKIDDLDEEFAVFCLVSSVLPSAGEIDTIRQLLVTGEPNRWSPTAEILQNFAARESHLQETIRPALENGAIVICDRFSDSTRAYQGYAENGDKELIEQLDQKIVGNTQPDLTIIFDLEPDAGLDRAVLRGGDDRFERKGLEFHTRLRQAYLEIAEKFPDRCRVIDASQAIEDVSSSIWQIVTRHFEIASK